MGEIIGGLIGLGFMVLTTLMCRQESQKKKINFWLALLICFAVTPIFGYFIVSSFPLRNPIGCKWCGNGDSHNDVKEFRREKITGIIPADLYLLASILYAG